MKITKKKTQSFAGFYQERVDALLAEQGKRRPWLANTTGISLSTINGWFARGTVPNLLDALKILNALSISLEEFVGPYMEAVPAPRVGKKRKTFDRYLNLLNEDKIAEFIGCIKMFIALRCPACFQKNNLDQFFDA